MSQTWNVRIEGSTRKPFKYHATLVYDEPGARLTPLLPAYFYAEGDLAAFLDDCGAKLPEIAALLETLEMAPDARITVAPPDELLEVFWAKQV